MERGTRALGNDTSSQHSPPAHQGGNEESMRRPDSTSTLPVEVPTWLKRVTGHYHYDTQGTGQLSSTSRGHSYNIGEYQISNNGEVNRSRRLHDTSEASPDRGDRHTTTHPAAVTAPDDGVGGHHHHHHQMR